MARDELIAELKRNFESLLDSVAGLSPEQMSEVWYGSWALKDLLAHIAGWHREMVPAFERIARGERPIPEDADYSNYDKWNESFAERYEDSGAAEILDELKESHDAFIDAAEDVPEEKYQEGRAAHRIILITGIEHYALHEPEIRAWREAQGI